jgi:hypothetical protein
MKRGREGILLPGPGERPNGSSEKFPEICGCSWLSWQQTQQRERETQQHGPQRSPLRQRNHFFSEVLNDMHGWQLCVCVWYMHIPFLFAFMIKKGL